MSAKYLRVEMPDGSKWDVPVEKIADHRAMYYANADQGAGENYTDAYKREYRYSLENDDELVEWAAGNMNWSDVEKDAVCIKRPDQANYEEGWVNGRNEIITK